MSQLRFFIYFIIMSFKVNQCEMKTNKVFLYSKRSKLGNVTKIFNVRSFQSYFKHLLRVLLVCKSEAVFSRFNSQPHNLHTYSSTILIT